MRATWRRARFGDARPDEGSVTWDRVVLLLTIAVSTGCAGATARARRTSCALAPADSTYLATGPVYRDCAVDQRARPRGPGVRPEFRPSSPPLGGTACYSAELEFVVDTTGAPELETARVVRTNDATFGDAVLATLLNWRYDPARKDGIAVRQIVREKRSMAVQVVAVREGQIPRAGRPPRC